MKPLRPIFLKKSRDKFDCTVFLCVNIFKQNVKSLAFDSVN